MITREQIEYCFQQATQAGRFSQGYCVDRLLELCAAEKPAERPLAENVWVEAERIDKMMPRHTRLGAIARLIEDSIAERPQLSAEQVREAFREWWENERKADSSTIPQKSPFQSIQQAFYAGAALLTGEAEKVPPRHWPNSVCFTCEGESGLPPSKTVDICEKCYGDPDDAARPSQPETVREAGRQPDSIASSRTEQLPAHCVECADRLDASCDCYCHKPTVKPPAASGAPPREPMLEAMAQFNMEVPGCLICQGERKNWCPTHGDGSPAPPVPQASKPIEDTASRAISREFLQTYFPVGNPGFWNWQTVDALAENLAAIRREAERAAFEKAAQVTEETVAEEFRKGWIGFPVAGPRAEIVAKYTARAIRALAQPAQTVSGDAKETK